MISILHPSRGRPHKSYSTIKKWVERIGVSDFEVIVSLDIDDICLNKYLELYEGFGDKGHTVMSGNNKSAIEAINRAVKEAKGSLFVVVSDDTDCPMHWGKRLLHAIGDAKDFVMKTDDGIQKTLITMPVFDKLYYQRDGYVYNPIYDHLFADREYSDVAYKRKRVIKKMGLKFPHDHYSRKNGQVQDETAMKNELSYASGKRIYLERQKINFGL